MGFQFSKKHFLIVGGVAVALAAAFWLLAGSQIEEEPPAETTRIEERVQAGDLKDPEHAAEPTFEPPETAPATDGGGQLPANWHQLTAAEKTALNPLDCPPDANGFIHLRDDNGKCLEPEEENIEDEDQPETPPKPGIDQAVLGRPFAYSQDLNVIVNSLVCRQANEGIENPTLEGFWTDAGAIYKKYVNRNGEKQAPDDGRSEAFETDAERYTDPFQKCRLVLTGINTGSDSYLPDGCGLSFERSAILVGRQKKYQALPLERICTKNIIDFPNGASNEDTLFFTVDDEDEITEIIVRNPFGDEKYSIAVVWSGATDFGQWIIF